MSDSFFHFCKFIEFLFELPGFLARVKAYQLEHNCCCHFFTTAAGVQAIIAGLVAWPIEELFYWNTARGVLKLIIVAAAI